MGSLTYEVTCQAPLSILCNIYGGSILRSTKLGIVVGDTATDRFCSAFQKVRDFCGDVLSACTF